jgi:formylglycine-generating enzyme required for sulfatase activity
LRIKKSSLAILVTAVIIGLVFFFTSYSKKTVTIFANEELTESMILIAAGTVSTVPVDEHASGPFAKASTANPISIAAFKIGACEVTYALWYKVYSWATTKESNPYIFENKGKEGNNGTEGGTPTNDRYEPVTNVSWRDCIVWCNAYSEYKSKTPVYFSDNSYTTIWRNSNSNLEKSLYIKSDTNGYRLPTEAEWEYADRGGNSEDSLHWNYTYLKSNNAINEEAWDIENSSDMTHPVASKKANIAGIYDMKGNVPEWCYDLYNATTNFRVKRGGAYYFCAEFCAVPYHAGNGPEFATKFDGFRICSSVF